MIISASPPPYLPGQSWMQVMAAAGRFIPLDDMRYSSSMNLNRTRIKTPDGTGWLTVPVMTRGASASRIDEVRIDTTRNWARKHWRSLSLNYRYAPYFEWYADGLEVILNRPWTSLIDLNLAMLAHLRDVVGGPEIADRASVLDPGHPEDIVDRITALCEACGADTYAMPASQSPFVDRKALQERGITLRMIQPRGRIHRQQFGAFESDLSVIDLLFNEGPEARNFLCTS